MTLPNYFSNHCCVAYCAWLRFSITLVPSKPHPTLSHPTSHPAKRSSLGSDALRCPVRTKTNLGPSGRPRDARGIRPKSLRPPCDTLGTTMGSQGNRGPDPDGDSNPKGTPWEAPWDLQGTNDFLLLSYLLCNIRGLSLWEFEYRGLQTAYE